MVKPYQGAWLSLCGVVLLGGVAHAANDLSGDVIPGSRVVNIEADPLGFRLNLNSFLTPEAGADGLFFPTDWVFDGLGRSYVTQLDGKVRVVEPNGTLLAAPLLDAGDWTDLAAGRDYGMTSVALHPDYLSVGTPGYGKVYTIESGIDRLLGTPSGATWWDGQPTIGRLDPDDADFAPDHVPTGINANFKANTEHRSGVFEYTVDPTNLAAGYSARREVLLTHQHHHGHNLSDLIFDPRLTPADPGYGLLYVGSADGGNGTEYEKNANGPAGSPGPDDVPDSVYGRILRIDPLDPNAPGVDLTNRAVFLGTDPADRDNSLAKFSVPTGALANPFFSDNGSVTGDDLTWAYGLRNPYRLYIDPTEPTTETTIISSATGQKNVEAVYAVTEGSDSGWGLMEGEFFYLGNSDNGGAIPTNLAGLDEAALQALQVTVAAGSSGSFTRSLTSSEISRILGANRPVFQYDQTNGVSPMGGLIYRGDDLFGLRDHYIFAEFQGEENSTLTDQDGRTIGDQALLLYGDPDDPLGQVFALTTAISGNDIPERILGFAETPGQEVIVYGFDFDEFGAPVGVAYRLDIVSHVIPEPALALPLLAGVALRRRRSFSTA